MKRAAQKGPHASSAAKAPLRVAFVPAAAPAAPVARHGLLDHRQRRRYLQPPPLLSPEQMHDVIRVA